MDIPDRESAEGNTPDRAGPPDHYAALQVQATASQHEISRAYRSLMRSLHPDVDGGGKADGPAEKYGPARKNELLRIMQAFAVLSDPERRAAYDQSIAGQQTLSGPAAGPQTIPVRYVRGHGSRIRHTIRITPVRWESGPWA